ncbi:MULTISPECIES: dephospho-CoA kinase [Gracilibacillus]|uniref:dephospho-CoA kinase n=1 Tax=Gracilibacillus TaxID=74385 RepID=UPI0008266FAB|nr:MULTISPECIES: dephospho-CoA kinase [Gracilibacillus]
MIIGITGNIATGKSLVSQILMEDYHIPVIDADLVAREVVEPGEPALHEIITVFGEEMLQADGTLDRGKLGKLIFQEKESRHQLNSIVHPAIRQRMQQQKETLLQQGHATIALDIPLLFENNLTYLVDRTIVVAATESVQKKRLMERNQLSKEEAEKRMGSQMDLEKKKQLADYVIDNSGTITETKQQVAAVLKDWQITRVNDYPL